MVKCNDLLLIRADASPRTGTGHVMRCLALAQAWQRAGGEVQFACAEITPSLEARLESEGFAVQHLTAQPGSASDAEQTIHLLKASSPSALRSPTSDHGPQTTDHRPRTTDLRPPTSAPPSWLVADGYLFDAAYQRAIKDAGLRLLLVDDYGHAEHYSADLVLNQNLSARADLYAAREPSTRLLLGTRYALLRGQFLAYKDWQREIPAVARKVLVTLGGADPDNVTGSVFEALRTLDVEAKVVVGGSNPHLARLKAELETTAPDFRPLIADLGLPTSDLCPPPSTLHLIEDAANMPELMVWADIAIAAGGTTGWELAFMGLPSVVIALADNQRDIATALHREALAIALGWHSEVTVPAIAEAVGAMLSDEIRRRAMSQRGRSLVDGNGIARVIMEMTNGGILLRRARPEDCRLIWKWANEPTIRAVSFSSEPIPWESHVRWFEAKLADPNCLLLIAENGQHKEIGQIRYELQGAEAEVSVSLDPAARGKGYGAAMIAASARDAFARPGIARLRAYTKPDNEASIRAFLKAGYTLVGETEVKGQRAIELALTREGWVQP
jgi:UDP-2,4-diacetamido-2,4,6-trideoxy-beta-L-altropyranose hydrolase